LLGSGVVVGIIKVFKGSGAFGVGVRDSARVRIMTKIKVMIRVGG
jgi:hypothetical protein